MTASTTTGTYFYSPDIKIFVKSSTVKDKDGNPAILDLSDDVMNFTISRQSNATSTATFQVANKGWKYTIPPANIGGSKTSLPVETMDQVVIYLKRDSYLQYFTGYITNAPILTLVPQPVTFQANCTIYKIQNTFWDVNNIPFQALMPGMLMATISGVSQWNDGGVAQGIVNVLGNVVGIPFNNIHVSAIPPTWVANATQTYNLLINTDNYLPQNGAQTFMEALDGAGIISGNNLINQKSGYVTYSGLSSSLIQSVAIPNGAFTNAIPPVNSALPANIPGQSSGVVVFDTNVKDVYKRYAGSSNLPQPVPVDNQDPDWWCVISWPYFVNNLADAADAAQWLGGSSVKWDNGRPLLITSIANANQVVVKASIAGNTGNNVVLSKTAWEYLAGSPIAQNIKANGTSAQGDFYYTDSIQVTVNWADPTKVHEGPVNTTNLVSQLESYGYSLGNTTATGGSSGTQVVTKTSSTSSTNSQTSTSTTKTVSTATGGGIHPPIPSPPPTWVPALLTAMNAPINQVTEDAIYLWAYAEGGVNSAYYNWLNITNPGNFLNVPKPVKYLNSDSVAIFSSQSQGVEYTVKFIKAGHTAIISAFQDPNATLQSIYTAIINDGAWKGDDGALSSYAGLTLSTTSTTPTPTPTTTPTTTTNTGTNFNISLTQLTVDPETLSLIGTPRAFVTDQPVLQSISTIVTSSLRQFQSAPNGDFLAWFPDYFGLYGQSPSLSIYDIEIIDFTIYHDDTQVVTHVGVSGDQVNQGTSVGLVDWMQSNGIVSVQIPQIMAILFGFASASTPETKKSAIDQLTAEFGTDFSTAFLSRYGMRPLVQEQPIIRSHVTEFMYAWQLFMQSWANQYSSTIQLTFIPELYPGMRIRLEDHGIEVYVQGVQHQGDRSSGFYTMATVTCPVYRASASDTNGVKLLHYGFPSSVG